MKIIPKRVSVLFGGKVHENMSWSEVFPGIDG